MQTVKYSAVTWLQAFQRLCATTRSIFMVKADSFVVLSEGLKQAFYVIYSAVVCPNKPPDWFSVITKEKLNSLLLKW